jgi:hypothetical protein
MSKGSGRRPTDYDAFGKNYDRIFNSKPNDKQFEGINDGSITDAENTKKIARKRRISSRASRGKVERICKD